MTTPKNINSIPELRLLKTVGQNAPTMQQKVKFAQDLRLQSAEMSQGLDEYLLTAIEEMNRGLENARDSLKKCKSLVDKLTSPPWHTARFLHAEDTSHGRRAVVVWNSSRRLVDTDDQLNLDDLHTGDEVFLSKDLNIIIGKSKNDSSHFGETAMFDRYLQDGRMALRCRDEEVIVDKAATLNDVMLKSGDEVRWDRNSWLAFEKIEQSQGKEFILEELPDIGRENVGGQDGQMNTLLGYLTASLINPDKAAEFGIKGRMTILMVGPPGCGKTLMARVAASEVSRISGQRCRFGVVKPGEWQSPWVGVTEANIRNCFKALHKASLEGPTVLFLDEIESIGRIRGGLSGAHSDRFLATLLAEMDGFSDRGNVAVIAATNRKDLIDPALLERLSDLEIQVDRPNMEAARAIFEIHLPPELRYQSNGTSKSVTRKKMIETAVSRFYSPNGHNELSVVKFRNGKTRKVKAAELASGRLFEQVCRQARQSAFLRNMQNSDTGIDVDDMNDAVSSALERLKSTLTPHNAHTYLQNIPQDMDVVSVEPIKQNVKHSHRYLMLNVN